ncbi:MAG: choice-of-anchor D domain-containing protein [Alphaproteobacteria bacterium]|nr:choice-of-anchor D domain-containing protein [Alphaproteobacteria bacterium]
MPPLRSIRTCLVLLAALSVSACGAKLTAPTGPFDFGKVLVGTSKMQQLVMTTSGQSSDTVTAIAILPTGGDHRQFSVASPAGGFPASVSPPNPLSTQVTFSPNDKKLFATDITAQLISGTPEGFPLKTQGEGVHNLMRGFVVMDVAPPSGLDFGEQTVGSTTRLTITFINSSPQRQTFTITKPATNSVFSTNISGTTVTLPAGAGVTYAVTFKPTAVTTYQDLIMLKVDDTNFAGIALLGKGKAGNQ